MDSEAKATDDPFESSLTYDPLSSIGRVQLDFVNDLSRHLEFDRPIRRLHIFRSPSFCIANVLQTPNDKVLERFVSPICSSASETNIASISRDFRPTTDLIDADPRQMLAGEMLLSYRVLFALNGRSRALVKSKSARTEKEGCEINPFLKQVCSQRQRGSFSRQTANRWPPSAQNFNDQLQE